MVGDIQNHCYQNFAHYQFLSKARNTIRRIEESAAPDAAKKLYAGEVKALRGWMGLYLYDMFGPVPVASDEVLDNPTDFKYLGKVSDEEYDEMMENDLRGAIAVLPEKASARGRMTKGAAMMILLKYYMIRGKYEQAETLSRELRAMEGKVYSLQSDYNYVFSKEGMGNSEIILATRNGLAIRFDEQDVRPMGRTAHGVRGVALNYGDEVVAMDSVPDENYEVLTATEFGMGKRTAVSEYRKQTRGGKGIINIKITEKTGLVIGMKVINPAQEIMMITAAGLIIRIDVDDISQYGRNAQGVKLMTLNDEDKVVSLAAIHHDEESDK